MRHGCSRRSPGTRTSRASTCTPTSPSRPQPHAPGTALPLSVPAGRSPGPAPAAGRRPHRAHAQDSGYPNGFDAGELSGDSTSSNLAEAVVNYLKVVGIRVHLRPLERAAFFAQHREKKLKNVIQASSGAFGSAATRLESFVVSGGAFSYGGYPDIDGLFREQANEVDRKRREATLHRIQQLVHDKVMYAPIWELVFINGIGPRVEESGLGLIAGHAYSAPYEDLKLKGK